MIVCKDRTDFRQIGGSGSAEGERGCGNVRHLCVLLHLIRQTIINQAEDASRVRWTAYVVQTAALHGFSFGYWEFASDFGLYDRETGQWHQGLLNALLGT